MLCSKDGRVIIKKKKKKAKELPRLEQVVLSNFFS